MKITISTESGEKEIDMKEPKGKDINKLWNFLMEMEQGDPKAVVKYFQYIDELTSKLSGVSMDELNDLFISQKKKLTDVVTKQIMGSLDFMNASQLQGNFTQRGGTKL